MIHFRRFRIRLSSDASRIIIRDLWRHKARYIARDYESDNIREQAEDWLWRQYKLCFIGFASDDDSYYLYTTDFERCIHD